MDCLDGGLDLVGPGSVSDEAGAHESLALVDEVAIPQPPVLLSERDEAAVSRGPRRPPRLG
jgi:hypothetical protein